MTTEYERLTQELRDFFEAVVPEEAHQIDVKRWAKVGLFDGRAVLNGRLLRIYGTSLEYAQRADVNNVGIGRQRLFKKLEFFYMCHNPAKLDDEAEVEQVVDRGLYENVQKLNRALKAKYGKSLSEVSTNLAVQNIMEYYKRVNIEKTPDDCLRLVKWGKAKGFCKLAQNLQDRYGQGFKPPEVDKRNLSIQIQRFLNFYDPENAEDAAFVKAKLQYAINNGRKKLNEGLLETYGATLDTIRGGQSSNRGRLAVLLKYGRWFLRKNDPSRLQQEGIPELREQLRESGEEGVNAALKEQYGEDLTDIESEAEELAALLRKFYKNYDPTGIPYIQPKVGFGIINGREALNRDLRMNYDDDLEQSGLITRLKFYFKGVGLDVSEEDIRRAAEWGFKHGIKSLGTRLERIYGQEFVTLQEFDVVSSAESSSETELPPILQLEPESTGFEVKKGRIAAFLKDVQEENEDIEKKLKTFYNFYDPVKADDEDFMLKQLEQIKIEGVQAYNATLQAEYGASLNTIAQLWRIAEARNKAEDEPKGDVIDFDVNSLL